MANIFDVGSEQADIAAAMGEVRRRLQERERAGITSPDLSIRLIGTRFEADTDAPDVQGTLVEVEAASRLDLQAIVRSSRPVLGPPINLFQRVVRRLTWWYTFPLMVQVALFQVQATRALKSLTRLVAGFEQRKIEERLQRLERRWQQGTAHSSERARASGARSSVEVPATSDQSHDTFLFHERWRGSAAEIRDRQRIYLQYFESGPVLDLGCGRGEFLELLQERGILAYGVDADLDMVLRCQEQGLDVRHADALAHLREVPDGTIGGIFSAHLIEHLDPAVVQELVAQAFAKLRSGAPLCIETPNPTSVVVGATRFWLDPTHVKPLHPEAAKFILETVGFQGVRVEFASPVAPEERLGELPSLEGLPVKVQEALQVMNGNFRRLNEVIFGPQDYAVIGWKP
ncbi:MAG: class I SAM-dependent methyltransferase [Chloroflexi bacterium]|nr:class I SAM-dependent methyltransferase [Chloroflexota bacterium]